PAERAVPVAEAVTAPPPPPRPQVDEEARLRELEERVLREKGAWLAQFGIEAGAKQAPAQFGHYFVYLGSSLYVTHGAIVRGASWLGSGSSHWRVVHGHCGVGFGHDGRDSYQGSFDVAYLGPTWDPLYVRLCEALQPETKPGDHRFVH